MMNIIWLLLIVIGVITSIITGQIDQITNAIFESCQDSIEIAIKLVGPMALWSGMMKITRKAKLTKLLAKIIKPITRFIFPRVSDNDSAMGAVLLNISANMLGLGNSATPLGIKAMEELQQINPKKNQASPAMCTLLALNTSSITIIPATIISLRAASGSINPAIIVVTTIFATSISTITAIILDKTFRVFFRFREGQD